VADSFCQFIFGQLKHAPHLNRLARVTSSAFGLDIILEGHKDSFFFRIFSLAIYKSYARIGLMTRAITLARIRAIFTTAGCVDTVEVCQREQEIAALLLSDAVNDTLELNQLMGRPKVLCMID